jgi:single-stranded DNA-specific DHH superfamily exonuclease
MLTEKQIKEIREHLKIAQNPIFFYDNDEDGLCSYVLLRKYIGAGSGVAVKSYPGLDESYFRKVNELNADYIFILDKPIVEESFFKESEKYNIPVVWIDHHDVDTSYKPKSVNYYNPVFNKKSNNEPTTYLSYQVSQRKEDLWIAVTGCVADHYLPEFYKDFQKQYPELSVKAKEPFEVYYNAEIGKVAKMLSFGLKDRTTNVVKMQKLLIKSKSPYDVLNEAKDNLTIHKRYNEIMEKYEILLKNAKEAGNQAGKILFFKFGGDLSIASYLSSEVGFNFKDKIVVIAHNKGEYLNMSIRGKNVRKILLETLKDFEGATGGGHPNAVGSKIKKEDWERFNKIFEKNSH